MRNRDKFTKNRRLKEALIKIRGNVCEICTFTKTKILVVHHVIERHNGGSDQLDNLKLICPNCHAEIHYGEE